jgi:hypothetical protein
MLKVIHAREDRKTAQAKLVEVVARLTETKLSRTLGTNVGRGETQTYRGDQAALPADGRAAYPPKQEAAA